MQVHPDLFSTILSYWVFFAFILFVITAVFSTFKRVLDWLEGNGWLRRDPPSVYNTLNVLNIDAESAEKLRSKRPDGI